MSIFKRALLYMMRSRIKTILLFILMFCLVLSVVLGGSVYESCSVAVRDIEGTADSFDQIIGYSVLSYGLASTDWDFIVRGNLTSTDVNWMYEDVDVETHNAYKKVFMDTTLVLYGDEKGDTEAYFYAVNETKLHDFFRMGAFEIADGRHIAREDENVCIIPEDISKINGLKVGDYIYPECTEATIKSGGDKNKIIVEAYPMEIIGIYKMNFDYAVPDGAYTYELPQNMIFADHISTKLWQDEISKATGEIYSSGIDVYDKETYFCDSPKTVDAVTASPTSNRIKNDAEYHSLTNALDSVGAYAAGTAFPISCGVTVLFFVLSLKFGKTRKREERVLIGCGFDRRQIFMQRFLETGIIVAVAAVIAVVLAYLLITPVSDMIKTADAARTFQPYTYEYIRADIQFGPEITQNGYLPEDFTVLFSSSAAAWGIIAASAVTLISASVSSKRVLKKAPLEIAMEGKKDKDRGA